MTNNFLGMATYLLLRKDPRTLNERETNHLVEALQKRLQSVIMDRRTNG